MLKPPRIYVIIKYIYSSEDNMKRIISLFIVLAISLSMLASCSVLGDIIDIIGPGSDIGEINRPEGYRYRDFTNAEKAILTEHVGEVIPFAPCNKYYFEGVFDEADFSYGVNYYTVGNTRADFDEYVTLYSDYELVNTYFDDDGDTWYSYAKDGILVDLSYYYHSNAYYIDVIACPFVNNDDGNTDDGDNGNTDNGNGDNGNGDNGNTDNGNGDNGNGDNGNTDGGEDTPIASDGYRTVDFTKAKNVKDVTDQGSYLDGCPTTGSPAVLVIPVEFSDVTAASKGYTTETLVKAWSGDADDTDYYSVHDYYYISSYGALDLDITVLDYWFRPERNSSYYERATMDYCDEDVMIGDQMIMDEALAELSKTMDLSEFDSDDNGIIDSVVLINTLDIGDDDFHWAYRYWNIYTDDEDYYYEYDGVSANDYLWASYQFLFETYDNSGDTSYDNTSGMNTYTYIHEFGHILGADDYYDTSYSSDSTPLDGCDIMDAMSGDHNAYTKFNYGWLTTSRLVTTDSSTTLTLEDFSKSGDTIIIANSWDDNLGAYQEYYIVVYYTNNGLNSDGYGYFARDGIVVYHVNATLIEDTVDGKTYYDVKNNNSTPSSDGYGTEDNLIEFVKSGEGNFTYIAGDSLPSVKDDSGRTLGYTFTVNSLTEDTATITFTKK